MKKLIALSMITGALFANSLVNMEITNSTIGVNAQVCLSTCGVAARGGYLYNDNDNRDDFYYAGIKAEGNLIGANIPGVMFSVFTDYVHTTDNSAVALGVGVFSYVPHFSVPVFVRGEYEYAPKVLSFDEADRFSRGKVEIGAKPIENAEVFAGYRHISFNSNYNSSVYVGLGYSF